MKRVLLAGVAALFLATGAAPAQACGCCINIDPTGTPLNVRDKPGGSILYTISENATIDYPEEEKRDSKGKLWALVQIYDEEGHKQKKGWVFRKYLLCG
jgi:hypothetical protein